jgi:nicotinamidase-related amidase
MKSALILIDIQNDYFEGGRNVLVRPEFAASNAKKVLDYYRSKDLPVYHVQHISTRKDASFFLPDSQGAEINDSVEPFKGEKVFIKHVPNSFFDTGLADELSMNHIEKITICGMMSHMCIDTTVRAAKELGLDVSLLQDACTTKDLEFKGVVLPADTVHQVFMAALHGLFAQVMTTDEFIERDSDV